jgi:hypothetical protein
LLLGLVAAAQDLNLEVAASDGFGMGFETIRQGIARKDS